MRTLGFAHREGHEPFLRWLDQAEELDAAHPDSVRPAGSRRSSSCPTWTRCSPYWSVSLRSRVSCCRHYHVCAASVFLSLDCSPWICLEILRFDVLASGFSPAVLSFLLGKLTGFRTRHGSHSPQIFWMVFSTSSLTSILQLVCSSQRHTESLQQMANHEEKCFCTACFSRQSDRENQVEWVSPACRCSCKSLEVWFWVSFRA